MLGAKYKHIEGVNGKVPFGAVITIGEKGPSGAPRNTDRFFICSPSHEEIKGLRGARGLKHPPHPSFAPFNNQPKPNIIRGNLVFPERDDCVNYHLLARQLPGKGKAPGGGVLDTPPNNMPACVGDGKTAERFNGIVKGEPQFIEIKCPNRLCKFRQMDKKVCGAFGRIYFRLRWDDNSLPSTTVRYQSHGWNTIENMIGLFDAVEEVARGMGLEDDQWGYTGLPFEMILGMRKTAKGRFPVVQFSADDIPGFLHWQAGERGYLKAAPTSIALIGDGNENEEGSRQALGEAAATITVSPGIPSQPTQEDVVDAEFSDVDPVEVEVPEVTQYKIRDDDPRGPVDRLLEFATDVLDLKKADLARIAMSVTGERASECSPQNEAIVADALADYAEKLGEGA